MKYSHTYSSYTVLLKDLQEYRRHDNSYLTNLTALSLYDEGVGHDGGCAGAYKDLW